MSTQPAVGRKIFALAAITGPLALLVGTLLHPSEADPNAATAAFAEYADARGWIAIHLMQLAGVALMTAALALFSRMIAAGPAAAAAALGKLGAGTTLAIAAALQAVDGIAVKSMVDAWAAAPEGQKEMIFQSAFSVRQIEIGLASIFGLVAGFTVMLYGVAQLTDARFPKWLGLLGLAGGALTFVGGLAVAYSHFSGTAMMINMPAGILVTLWMLALGIYVWIKPALLTTVHA